MARAGFIFIIVITGEFFNSIPLVWRFYEHIPLLDWITQQRSDRELVELSKCGYCTKKKV
jgi:hypothetical protein